MVLIHSDRSIRVLILEDIPEDVELVEYELRSAGMNFTAKRVDDRSSFEEALENFTPDIILSDLSLPFFDGKSALGIVLQRAPDLPFIFVTGAMGEDRAVDLLKDGATDLVLKDRLFRLPLCVKRALQDSEERLRRRKAEEDLKIAHAELDRKVHELQSFAFVASHDLSEPLRKIQTFGSLLQERCADQISGQARDYISRMSGAASRMQELLDALLRYSRIETQRRDLVPSRLEEIVRTVAADLDVSIKKAGAHLEIGPLPVIHGDPCQWRQLFQNLIANAVKYHRAEVKPVVKLYGEVKDGICRIFVEDNGIGFDEKYLEKIFEPFQRLHGRNEYPGTGIGLAICRKILERHHGSITARSMPGKGSTFIITVALPDQRCSLDPSTALVLPSSNPIMPR